MSSEKFDNKIIEAAENHHPAYDEQAWSRMEKLLDKHLPVKKKKGKRIVFILFFFFLLAGTGFYYTNRIITSTTNSTRRSFEKNGIVEKIESKNQSIEDKKTYGNKVENKINHLFDRNTEQRLTNSMMKKYEKIFNTTNLKIAKNKPANINTIRQLRSAAITRINKVNDKNNPAIRFNNPDDMQPAFSIRKDDHIGETDSDSAEKTANSIIKPVTANNIHSGITIVHPHDHPITEKNNKKSVRRNSFFLTLSAGPVISYAGSEKAGQLKSLFGLGAGFSIENKITLRSGFYTGHKVYTATSSSYNPPPSFFTYYPVLEKVEADCKVYEIPFTVSYNFEQTSKQNWFLSAGISSFLMKTEAYNYYYKNTAGGPLLNRQWSIHNENQHFFSVLTMSGGFRRQLSQSIFVMGEPYIKLPLSGIGYGKVKLNSTGILFTIGVTPFQSSGK